VDANEFTSMLTPTSHTAYFPVFLSNPMYTLIMLTSHSCCCHNLYKTSNNREINCTYMSKVQIQNEVKDANFHQSVRYLVGNFVPFCVFHSSPRTTRPIEPPWPLKEPTPLSSWILKSNTSTRDQIQTKILKQRTARRLLGVPHVSLTLTLLLLVTNIVGAW